MSAVLELQQPVKIGIHSYEEYLEASEANPLLRVEYIDGEIYMSPAPRPIHQRVSRNLFVLLYHYATDHKFREVLFAPLDVEFQFRGNTMQPDLIFIRQERIESIVGEKRLHGPPDLLVEVLSPENQRLDRKVKLPAYARHKVPEYWIADWDDQAVEVYLLDGDTYRVAGIFLSGTRINVGQFSDAAIMVDNIFKI